MNAFFIASAIISSICVAWWVVKSEMGATSFFLSALQGVAALFAVNLTGMMTGVTIAVNWYTVVSYIVLGLPGVIGTLVIDTVLAK